jgi:hypothetical protein
MSVPQNHFVRPFSAPNPTQLITPWKALSGSGLDRFTITKWKEFETKHSLTESFSRKSYSVSAISDSFKVPGTAMPFSSSSRPPGAAKNECLATERKSFGTSISPFGANASHHALSNCANFPPVPAACFLNDPGLVPE